MNLGDGLVFELENGKPKLVLAHCGESKASGKMGVCKVPPKNRQLKATAISKLGPKAEERWQRDRKCRDISRGVNHAEPGSRKTKPQSRTDRCSVIGVVRVPSESKTESANETSNVKSIKESLVCLTQEQLQQILNSVKASGQNARDDSTAHVQNGPAAQEEETETVTSASGKDKQINSPGKGNAEKTLSDSTPAGLFSTFGEHEQKRNTLEAKKAQWRRELDEQMALKKQLKESAEILARSEQPRDTEAGPRSSDQLFGVQKDRITQMGTENANNRPPAPQTRSNPMALPSAIRSAFVLGEAAPLEHAFSAEKKEQQRRWLQDLEQQREETKLRRKLEKQSQNQPEDHERWAMHFDSFQQRLPVQPPSTAELNLYSSLSQYRAPSQALSTAWETASTCGGDSMGRASVDTTQGCQPKSSYLRTMTALLDPAQIEERERKRVKQLEFQRAIDVQVEERRRQKEKEEAIRQIMEQKEELRVAKQWELENLRDTQLQRQKELQARKTEELYRNMQRTSEEVQKHKHLMEKGHDVSNQLRSETTSQALIGQGSESSATLDTITEAPHTARKDTAVQTETNPGRPFPETNGGIRAAVEYKAPPDIKRSRRDGRLAEKDSGKENMCAAVKGADPYEAYARTDRTHGRQQLCHRPEWNKHRPGKAFVPASERYPATQQKHRQENKMRRQMELMNLAERNTRSRTPQQAKPPRSGNPSRVQQHSNSACQKDEDSHRVQSASQISRVPSPPVPAVLRRLQVHPPSCAEEQSESCGRPPSADYVPYVRTDEVYHLDPLAPISRPTTNEGPQRIHADLSDVSSRQHTSPLVQRDPLLHPELLKGTERQQAILKGLSELRQSLLQKQRELETSLGPLLQGQSRTQISSPPERTTDVGREYDRYTPALYSPQGNTH
ncbi:coiled-coil domain-containing protein 66 isoform X1 [Ictalurus punctatus]|uniref:Coiled-coil domain-containing protein 66 isoform X1 n=1 Tax=Ictalurus punctatus TaxID=7998 RepID=A0A2D0PI45_ICTPU|nr:coiled-coil domain-containing protein 66 isoform X1 [Ictalurus punctatus]